MKKEGKVLPGDGIRLGSIEVRMGDQIAKLTIEQARELSALLKGLFGDDSTKIVHVRDYIYQRPWYMGPYWSYSGSNWNVTVDTVTNTSALDSTKSYTMNFCATK